MSAIPVMRPRLPAAKRLLPYLKRIDAAQVYSNRGPLVRTLEDRLAHHFDVSPQSITTVANGTLGLALALAAQRPPAGTLCVVPAWTFVASAHAITLAGLVPYFVDIDAETGMLDPTRLDQQIARAGGPVSAVMPVVAFGQRVDVTAWDRVRSRGLAIVIDAAAAFDSLQPGEAPAVVSLHATKIVGVGEGGFIASKDTSLIRSIQARANFGFQGSRQAVLPSINAKLSEYHAAVGLAALDDGQARARSGWTSASPIARRCRNRTSFDCRSVSPPIGLLRLAWHK